MHEAAVLDELFVSRQATRAPTLSRLLRLAELPVPPGVDGADDPRIHAITHDSNAVQPGDVFVAIKGSRDGADFAAAAVARGAVAVVAASPDRGVGVPWIVVADDRAALADLAAAFHAHPSRSMLVFGITGTNGKTTTTTACAGILGAAGASAGIIGTVEARWPGHVIPSSRTTPEATDVQRLLDEMARDGCVAAAVEISSHCIDLQRARGIRFAAVGFTNLSQDHLDWHGDLETYYGVKRRLFTELAPDAPAVICADDQHGRRLAAELRSLAPHRVVVTVGFSPDADLVVTDFVGDASGSTFRLVGAAAPQGLTANVDAAIRLRLPGRHNASNAAVAAGLALVAGAPESLVSSGLDELEGVSGRLEPVPEAEPLGFSVFVDFAHTPAALEGVLSAAREFCEGRLICVFGCGGDKDRGKRGPMGAAVGALADIAVATSDNPRSEDPEAIIAAACEGLRDGKAAVHVEPDRRAAIALAIDMARPGDVVILAGKGHETYQEIAGRRIAFDDRLVARELLLRRSGR